ncbi:MAG: hypothetical protein DRJ15_11235 [Bacteroidetes bacterium]|nr:MAG: hypothetical protein DRJ15_11235 [Bacteroidota bacterium]
MKKLLIGFALVCFVAFGTLGIQSAVASVDNMEIVKLQLDDDPDKNKKAEAKTDGKTKCAKSCDKKKCCPDDSKAKCETKSKECKTKCNDKKTPAKEGDGNK